MSEQGMIKTLDELREAFLMWKLPRSVLGNSLAMKAWEDALALPNRVNIWKFYCLSGMMYNDKPILWSEIKDDA